MITQSNKQPQILQQLTEAFKTAATSADFVQIKPNKVLLCYIVQKIDKNFSYVTDGCHTILAISAQKKEETLYHPLNRSSTPHYTFQAKSYLYLNFTAHFETIPTQSTHPYNPHFYFKDRFSQFLQVRKTQQLKNPCERYRILKWSLGLVNISTTGYYAPIILIEQYKKEFVSNFPSFLNLNCILWEPIVQKNLQKYRIYDIRVRLQSKLPGYFNISLFYFLRQKKRTTNFGKASPLVALDFNQKILKYSQEQNKHHVLIGNLKGPCSFTNPLKNQFNRQKIEDININEMSYLFEGLKVSQKKKNQKIEQGDNQIQLWSDSESDHSDPNFSRQVHPNNDSQSSDQDEDPLRNIYIKALTK